MPTTHSVLITLLLLLSSAIVADRSAASSAWTDPDDVTWTTPSKDAAGSMPMGNGELGINLWVEENGDLLFYLSRSDSLSEISRLLKVGEVRVSIRPNPFTTGQPFQQRLHLNDGTCTISAGRGAGRVSLHVFVDAGFPVVHITGSSAAPVRVTAAIEDWRTEPRVLHPGEEESSAWSVHDAPFPLIESADVFPPGPGDAVAWYHRNETSVVPSTLEVQSLQSAATLVHDPLIHRTFGGWITGAGFQAGQGHTLESEGPVKAFALRVAAPCLQSPTAPEWLDAAGRTAAETADPAAALRRTRRWWQAYWDRARIVVHGDGGIVIPGAEHPLRIGYDSDGQNRFPGSIGRLTIYGRSLSPEEIGRLASAGHDAPAPVSQGLQLSGTGTPREIPARKLDFKQGFTVEAWIHPDTLQPGRIFDRLTAGERDGFLFDTYPGNTLRLIVGGAEISAPPDSLKAGQWQDAAATVDSGSGALRIYLDGRLVAEQPGFNGSSFTRGYVLQRYMQACGGRGVYPIKFNGGIFTVEPKAMGKPYDADWRAWGDDHWWQNVRHMYHPMLAGGDVEMTDPLFRMYEAARPLAEARTKLYHDARGAYFPETMTVWGTYSNGDYGWNRTGLRPEDVQCDYWRYAWNQGPELVALMLDRWDYSGDEAFLEKQVLPMAESVLQYFDTRFKKDADGRIILDPTQSVETYWTGVINDMPTTAGLIAVTRRLAALPERLTTPGEQAFFSRMKAACPAIPMEEVESGGQKVKILAPAQKYDKRRSNVENPELYAVWPFHLYGVGMPDLKTARATYAHRLSHLDAGWGYDGNCAALLGLADEAARIMKVKCANSNPAYRWPATWGPNFDWLPDQNHGGNLLETAQLMLLQSFGARILLLPAWPKNWDVEFKLHAPENTTVECTYRAGTIERLKVTPESRRGDVVLPATTGR